MVRLVRTLARRVTCEEDKNRCHENDSKSGRRSLTIIKHDSSAAIQSQAIANHHASTENQSTLERTFSVVASNFVPGTTAADIKSAILCDSVDSEGRNCLLSCRLTCARPSVTAELVFSECRIADHVIRKYHNQRADGRLLRLVHKWESDTAMTHNPHPNRKTAKLCRSRRGGRVQRRFQQEGRPYLVVYPGSVQNKGRTKITSTTTVRHHSRMEEECYDDAHIQQLATRQTC